MVLKLKKRIKFCKNSTAKKRTVASTITHKEVIFTFSWGFYLIINARRLSLAFERRRRSSELVLLSCAELFLVSCAEQIFDENPPDVVGCGDRNLLGGDRASKIL